MDNKIFQEIDQLHSESKMDNASMSLGAVTSGENLMRIESVGDTVKRIASSYVYYYNRKYGRDGHLFKERFKSEPVNDMAYFTVLLRYIHQNPVKAGIVEKVKDYEFSSWGEYDGTVELNEQREQNQMNLSYAES